MMKEAEPAAPTLIRDPVDELISSPSKMMFSTVNSAPFCNLKSVMPLDLLIVNIEPGFEVNVTDILPDKMFD